MPRHVVAALTAAVLVSLTACSSGADPKDVTPTSSTFTNGAQSPTTAAPNPNPVTSPSPGAVVSSDKVFNFVVPSGWNLSKKAQAVAYLSSATVAHNVAPTIAITRSKVSPAPTLDKTVQMAMMQARQDGASVERLPERTVGGEKSVAFTAKSTEKNVELQRTYTMVAHDKALYVITLTSAQADAKRDEATLTSFLAGLTWTKKGDKGSTASGTTPAPVPTSTSNPPKPSSSSSSTASSSSSSSKAPSSSGKATGSAKPSSSTSTKPTASSTSK